MQASGNDIVAGVRAFRIGCQFLKVEIVQPQRLSDTGFCMAPV